MLRIIMVSHFTRISINWFYSSNISFQVSLRICSRLIGICLKYSSLLSMGARIICLLRIYLQRNSSTTPILTDCPSSCRTNTSRNTANCLEQHPTTFSKGFAWVWREPNTHCTCRRRQTQTSNQQFVSISPWSKKLLW